MSIAESGPVRRRVAAALALCAVAAVVGACGGSDDDDGAAGSAGGNKAAGADTGATITMWTRAATQAQSERLVKQYNADAQEPGQAHRHPDGQLPGAGRRRRRRQGPAGRVRLRRHLRAQLHVAGAVPRHHRPDRRAAVQGQPRPGAHAPRHLRGQEVRACRTRSTCRCCSGTRTSTRRPGSTPRSRPTTMQEFAEQATTIRDKLGGDTYGTFFGGNCGGCYVFTFWPSVWAGGGDGHERGRAPRARSTTRTWRPTFDDLPRAWSRTASCGPAPRTRPARPGPASSRRARSASMPMPSTTLGLMPADMDIGVAPIPGPDGGESTFVGGDVLGISATSKNADAAWDFLSWTRRRRGAGRGHGQEQGRPGPHRPRGQQVLRRRTRGSASSTAWSAKGETPYALNFSETYNDPTGPVAERSRATPCSAPRTSAQVARATAQRDVTGSLAQ